MTDITIKGHWGYPTAQVDLLEVFDDDAMQAIFRDFADRCRARGDNYWLDISPAKLLAKSIAAVMAKRPIPAMSNRTLPSMGRNLPVFYDALSLRLNCYRDAIVVLFNGSTMAAPGWAAMADFLEAALNTVQEPAA